ncbi:hypothetical protein B0H21DRAFT_779031 [Amylocystis lapponica]|nr:hypothetical protein B0H21DRAFT_779031 [Amylocystis lapponica]
MYGDRFSLVKGARSSLKKGSKAQYYPISPPQNDRYNPDRPQKYDLNNLPLRSEKEFWETIEKLNNASSKTARAKITKDTGISRMLLAAATFFPLDPFHLFFENIVAFIWDIWTTYSSPNESVHISKEILKQFGKLVVAAMSTLPPSFCSVYKIYEWMALVYWYILPIGIELGFNPMLLANFSQLVDIYDDLHIKITQFLTGFQTIYIGDNPEQISQFRLCIFQLIHVSTHIMWYGSIRLGSQATVERMIGALAPFANLANIIFEKQLTKSETISARPALFTKIPVLKKKRSEGQALFRQLKAAFNWLQQEFDPKAPVTCWGKLRLLSRGVVLNTQLSKIRDKHLSRSHRYFEACTTENKSPIFGEALVFLKIEAYSDHLVLFHPLVNVTNPLNTCRGKWSQDLKVLPISEIVDVVGIWSHEDNVYILRKHPGLDWLSVEEKGLEADLDEAEG